MSASINTIQESVQGQVVILNVLPSAHSFDGCQYDFCYEVASTETGEISVISEGELFH